MPSFNELSLSKDLIKFPSVTPVDAGAINFLSKKLKSLGFKCKILEFSKGKGRPIKNLYARLGKKQPNLCYAGHTDVVPPGDYNQWTVNPFKPAVKNGYLIGRGANDMKSSIACFISAVSQYLKNNKKINGSISLLITGDEATNPKKLGEMIKIGRRGSLTAELEIFGTQGHIAYPHLTNNPINTLVKICYELKKNKLDNGNKNFQPSNLEFTSIQVDNKAHNVIPATAKTLFNIRYNNIQNANKLKNKINKIIKRIVKKSKCKYKISYLESGDSFLTTPGKNILLAKKIIKNVTKINPVFSTTGGTSDARFIKKIAPCLEFGLVNKTMHKVDECVSLKDLKNLKKIYFNFLKEYFK